MKPAYVIRATGPQHWEAESHCKTGLEIHAPTLACAIGDNKAASTNLRNDSVVNAVNVLNPIDPYR